MKYEPRLGSEPPKSAQRDAIHIAVVPAVTDVPLSVGQAVGIVDGKIVPVSQGVAAVGIVDPFLRGGRGYDGDVGVYAGERFWLLLYPGTITSLRHEWQHPAFPLPEGDARMSELYLRERADRYDISFEELVSGAVSGDGGCFGSDDGPEWTRGAEFWQHMSIYTGKIFSSDHVESTSFHCSC